MYFRNSILKAIEFVGWTLFWFISIVFINSLFLGFFLARPFSSRLQRRLGYFIMSLVGWPSWGFMIEQVAQHQVDLYGDFQNRRDENAMVITNHQYWCDWMFVNGVFAPRFGEAGAVTYMAKASIRWIPIVGTGLMVMGTVFLTRDFDRDLPRLRKTFYSLLNDGLPFWVVSHPEGSRFTAQKLLESKEFARERRLPEPRHVLMPRVKGFLATIKGTRPKLDAIYDITFAYAQPPSHPFLVMLGWPRRIRVAMHLQRFEARSLPLDDDEKMRDWLYARWHAKDELLEYFHTHNAQFPGPKITDRPAPVKRTALGILVWILIHAIYQPLFFFVALNVYRLLKTAIVG